MMYEIRRKKTEPTLLPNKGIFNLPHHIGLIWEGTGLWWCCKSYTAGKWIAAQLNVMANAGFILLSSGLATQHFNQLSYLPNHERGMGGLMEVCIIPTKLSLLWELWAIRIEKSPRFIGFSRFLLYCNPAGLTAYTKYIVHHAAALLTHKNTLFKNHGTTSIPEQCFMYNELHCLNVAMGYTRCCLGLQPDATHYGIGGLTVFECCCCFHNTFTGY